MDDNYGIRLKLSGFIHVMYKEKECLCYVIFSGFSCFHVTSIKNANCCISLPFVFHICLH